MPLHLLSSVVVEVSLALPPVPSLVVVLPLSLPLAAWLSAVVVPSLRRLPPSPLVAVLPLPLQLPLWPSVAEDLLLRLLHLWLLVVGDLSLLPLRPASPVSPLIYSMLNRFELTSDSGATPTGAAGPAAILSTGAMVGALVGAVGVIVGAGHILA